MYDEFKIESISYKFENINWIELYVYKSYTAEYLLKKTD